MEYVNKVRTSNVNNVRVSEKMNIPATTTILLVRDLIYRIYELNNRLMQLKLNDEQLAALAGVTDTHANMHVTYPDFVNRAFYAKKLPTTLFVPTEGGGA